MSWNVLLSQKNSYRNKVKPEEVGHPVFMILAYPMVNKKTGKRARKVLYFHHMSSAAQEAVEFQVRFKNFWIFLRVPILTLVQALSHTVFHQDPVWNFWIKNENSCHISTLFEGKNYLKASLFLKTSLILKLDWIIHIDTLEVWKIWIVVFLPV